MAARAGGITPMRWSRPLPSPRPHLGLGARKSRTARNPLPPGAKGWVTVLRLRGTLLGHGAPWYLPLERGVDVSCVGVRPPLPLQPRGEEKVE